MDPVATSPLARKLKLKPGARAAVVGAPSDYLERLAPPPDVRVVDRLIAPLDWAQVFVRDSTELAAIVPELVAALEPVSIAWISYPKGSSKLQTDLTRDRGWESLNGGELMWLSLVSIDDVWSAFGLRPYKPG